MQKLCFSIIIIIKIEANGYTQKPDAFRKLL